MSEKGPHFRKVPVPVIPCGRAGQAEGATWRKANPAQDWTDVPGHPRPAVAQPLTSLPNQPCLSFRPMDTHTLSAHLGVPIYEMSSCVMSSKSLSVLMSGYDGVSTQLGLGSP